MKLIEKKGNLFSLNKKDYHFVHCVSLDDNFKVGIAKQFQKNFHIKNRFHNKVVKFPSCVQTKNVFNLVTKKHYGHKPTYNSQKMALKEMRTMICGNNIKQIAMSKIGCGLDGLSWLRVKHLIEEIFSRVDVLIVVKYL